VTGAMEALRKLAGPRRFLLAGDSKLLSYANIGAMIKAGVSFLAPASKAFVPASVLAGCGYNAADPVNYIAGRDAGRPEASRGRYRVAEDTMTITGPRRKDPSYTLRRVFVHSSANADAASRARARKLDQAADDLDRLTRGLGSRHYPDTAKVTTRLTAIAAGRRVGGYLRADAGTGPDGRPTLQWRFDQAAIDAEAATDGWYALLTNLPAGVTAAQVLARYKNQPAVSERRYHDLKGPLAVAPMFLHSNRRITAIAGVICMALLIYCLAERQARRNLARAVRLDGLYADLRAIWLAMRLGWFPVAACWALRSRAQVQVRLRPAQMAIGPGAGINPA
jgi:transposase